MPSVSVMKSASVKKQFISASFDDDEEDGDDDGIRKANYQILKNKGLTATRKSTKPRVRKRKQSERMSKGSKVKLGKSELAN